MTKKISRVALLSSAVTLLTLPAIAQAPAGASPQSGTSAPASAVPQNYVVIDPATGVPVSANGQMPRLQARPASLPYIEGAPIPPGYALQESNLTGLVIGGVIPLGVLYLISFSVASGNDFKGAAGWLAVPVIGPFGWLAAHKSTSNCYSDVCDASERTFVTLDGLFQAAGAAMFVTGLAITRKKLVLLDQQQIYVVPYSSSNAHGLTLLGTF